MQKLINKTTANSQVLEQQGIIPRKLKSSLHFGEIIAANISEIFHKELIYKVDKELI
jgi:hypothetical protein